MRLRDVAQIKTRAPDADFWLIRRGSPAEVGRPVDRYHPEHIGIRVTARDRVEPRYLYYALMALHARGVWRAQATGTLALVHIRVQDVGAIPLGGQGLGAAAWDPAYGQSPPYARGYARARVPVTQIASPFMNPISQDRVDELAALEDAGYDLPPVIVDGPSEVEEVDYPEEKYPFLDGHYPEVGEDVWYVHDGHHRVMRAIQQGRRFIDALVMG